MNALSQFLALSIHGLFARGIRLILSLLLSQFNGSLFRKLIVLWVITSSISSSSIAQVNCNYLCNSFFEDSLVAPEDYLFFAKKREVPCWQTTASDSVIEVWNSGCFGVPAYQGVQFVELNANEVSSLYQGFSAQAGTELVIGFAHRGRNGRDAISVSVGTTVSQSVPLDTFVTDNSAWVFYTLRYKIPAGVGNNFVLCFNSIYAAGNDKTIGNFLDYIVIELEKPVIKLTEITGDTCELKTGRIRSFVEGGSPPFSYFLDHRAMPDSLFGFLAHGIYTVEVADYYGCRDTQVFVVPDIRIRSENEIVTRVIDSCGQTNLFHFRIKDSLNMGRVSVLWEFEDIKLNGFSHFKRFSQTGQHRLMVIIINKGNCMDSFRRVVNVWSRPDLMPYTEQPLQCISDNYFVVREKTYVKPFCSFWYSSDGGVWLRDSLFRYQTPGEHKVAVRAIDKSGCDSRDTVKLFVIAKRDASFGVNVLSSCLKTNRFEFVARDKGNHCHWTMDGIPSGNSDFLTVQFSRSGLINVILVTDTMGLCKDTSSQQVQVFASPVVAIMADTVCEQQPTSFSVYPIELRDSVSMWHWSMADQTADGFNVKMRVRAGKVPVRLIYQYAKDCWDTIDREVEVLFREKINVSIGYLNSVFSDTLLCYDLWPIELSGSMAKATWMVDDGFIGNNFDPRVSFVQDGKYKVRLIASDAYGCMDTAIHFFYIELPKGVFIPDAFSPNGDGLDDCFIPVCDKNLRKGELSIYNRWGELIFFSDNSHVGWDGTFHGSEAEQDVYLYTFKAWYSGNKKFIFRGTLTLLR